MRYLVIDENWQVWDGSAWKSRVECKEPDYFLLVCPLVFGGKPGKSHALAHGSSKSACGLKPMAARPRVSYQDVTCVKCINVIHHLAREAAEVDARKSLETATAKVLIYSYDAFYGKSYTLVSPSGMFPFTPSWERED